jgi:glyoxylase-like metal-dependent hydrolase (beta-lactamase superfamily II)/rhodanese-related sulfurtransferase
MEIKQFEDKNLAHYSYAIICKEKMVIIDPERDLRPYYDFAKENNAKITAVIETHPHADFISSHLEIHETTGVTIFCSKLLGAQYPHQTLDEGQFIQLGEVKLKAWNTLGHSPDSISIILEDEGGKDVAAFTGDTLFIGDCGRPDLREKAGNIQQKREEQSRQMYHSLKKFLTLNDDVIIYPAHGSGSLCGRSMSDQSSNTIGNEKFYNWCLQPMGEDEFATALNEHQPYVPLYFSYDVDLNSKGAPPFIQSIEKVNIIQPVSDQESADKINQQILVVDTRDDEAFKRSHLENSVNIQNNGPFETWLGSIVAPFTPFYLAAENEKTLRSLIRRMAKIGYEPFIELAFVLNFGSKSEPHIDLNDLRSHTENYQIVDVRNEEEAKNSGFKNSLNIPLHSLKDRLNEIPKQKPVVVHCASGYRSAIGSSILRDELKDDVKVFDLGEAIKQFI